MRCFAIYNIPSALDGSGPVRELILLSHWNPSSPTHKEACRGLVAKFDPYCISITAITASEPLIPQALADPAEPLAGMLFGWEMTLAGYERESTGIPGEIGSKISAHPLENVRLEEFTSGAACWLSVRYSSSGRDDAASDLGLRFCLVDPAGKILTTFIAEAEGRMRILRGL
jgi:hypothetical protein